MFDPYIKPTLLINIIEYKEESPPSCFPSLIPLENRLCCQVCLDALAKSMLSQFCDTCMPDDLIQQQTIETRRQLFFLSVFPKVYVIDLALLSVCRRQIGVFNHSHYQKLEQSKPQSAFYVNLYRAVIGPSG